MIEVTTVSFSAWKYNHNALLFLSDIVRLHLCVACMLLAEPTSLFVWCCWDTWRYNIKSQEEEEEQSVPLHAVRSSTWKQRTQTARSSL